MNVEPEAILYRDHIFKLVDVDIEDEDAEDYIKEIELGPKDWVNQHYDIDETGQLKATISMDLPYKANNFQKGRIAEYFGAELLEYLYKYLCTVKKPGEDDDVTLHMPGGDIRIDVKWSKLYLYTKKSYRWQFHKSTGIKNGKIGKNKKQISAHKQCKDYTKSCDWIVGLGRKRDGKYEMFIFPSNAEEVIGCKNHIPVPERWETSKFAKFHIDTSHLQ